MHQSTIIHVYYEKNPSSTYNWLSKTKHKRKKKKGKERFEQKPEKKRKKKERLITYFTRNKDILMRIDAK